MLPLRPLRYRTRPTDEFIYISNPTQHPAQDGPKRSVFTMGRTSGMTCPKRSSSRASAWKVLPELLPRNVQLRSDRVRGILVRQPHDRLPRKGSDRQLEVDSFGHTPLGLPVRRDH